ncbi:LPXTG cell wall anchor domain-containing protein [Brevibacterium sp. 50QC2O2]|uniref:LPXTG cell wall anchor domain-containing protein n=1 Tax=Brevibacterium sp. 50QC2O2 TaxID=2968459 RepID=UPI00211B9F7A|nr:trypsin-like serine protease [Brevibacterium sp. 50QC2O2]MCQ9388255.1 LPXTG cell wall anchor domain-containing protein [Brevibacterium sp. 50QC2O2]
MHAPTPGKKLAAIGAAAALAAGSAMIAAPAMAAPAAGGEGGTAFAKAASTAFAADTKAAAKTKSAKASKIAAMGFGKDGEVVVQSTDKALTADSDELKSIKAYAAKEGKDLKVSFIGTKGYEAYGATAKIDKKSVAKGETFADNGKSIKDLVNGAGYIMLTSATQGSLCSTGFNATEGGKPIIITAGHCTEGMDGKKAYREAPSSSEAVAGKGASEFLDGDASGAKPFGTVTYSQFGPTAIDENETQLPEGITPAKAQDFGLLAVDGGLNLNQPGVTTNWNEKDAKNEDNLAKDTTPVKGVHDVTTKDVGSDVWRSGRTTGKQTGPIGYEDQQTIAIVDGYSNIGGRLVYGFASETLADHGDSGGAVMKGDQAVGVVSGGSPAKAGHKAFLWTAELAEGLTQLKNKGHNVKVTTDGDTTTPPGTPEPTDTTTAPTEEPTTPAPTDEPTTTAPTEEPTSPAPTTTAPTEKPTTDAPTTPAPTSSAPTTEPTQTSKPTQTTEAPKADPKLTIDPKKVSAKNFVNEKKGVTLKVANLEKGQKVDFTVSPSGKNVKPYELTATADANGTAQWKVYGTSASDPEVYVGKYQVKAQPQTDAKAANDPLTGSFQVVSGDANPGGGDNGDDNGNGSGDNGSDDNGSGDNGKELPKTGVTSAPLLGGAIALILVGAATVFLARRKKN